jgi:iron complex transport system substrate-binding protein
VASRALKLTALAAVAVLVFFSRAPLAQGLTPQLACVEAIAGDRRPGIRRFQLETALPVASTQASSGIDTGSPPRRIVSLVPAITEMLFAVGAGPQVAAVSSYDEFPPEVKELPKVGALLDPDTERIFALRSDLVVVYGSQSDLQTQLQRAGIRTFSYRHGGIATILDTIRELGAVTGHEKEAGALVSSLQTRLDAVRDRVKDRPQPRVLLVFERQPGALRDIYASGGAGFLHEMLNIAGGRNVFADVQREAVQPSLETLLARAPDVILEVSATGLIAKSADAGRDAWSTLSSIPAVRSRRVHVMTGDYLVVPGPRLAMATEAFAHVLHPEAFK